MQLSLSHSYTDITATTYIHTLTRTLAFRGIFTACLHIHFSHFEFWVTCDVAFWSRDVGTVGDFLVLKIKGEKHLKFGRE